MTGPTVSVLMVTYKHERYLAQALDSVLMQRVSFDIEILIGDDCSPDRTGEIVRDYAAKYPDRIRPFLRTQNLGGRKNWLDLYQNCRGKYVAYLEGDDFWTCADKLQRQVDLLESRPELSMCFHAADLLEQDTGARQPFAVFSRSEFCLADLARTNPIPTASVVVRNGLLHPLPEVVWHTPVGDWLFHVLHARHGNIGYIDQVMSVYRLHSGGVSHAFRNDVAIDASTHQRMCELMAEHLGHPERAAFDEWAARWSVDVAIHLGTRPDRRAPGALAAAWRRRRSLPRPFPRFILRRVLELSPSLDRRYRRARGLLTRLRRLDRGRVH